jgi:hypothetical protein
MIRLVLATLAGWAAGFVAGAWFAAASQRERAWVCLRCRERVALGDVHGCSENKPPWRLHNVEIDWDALMAGQSHTIGPDDWREAAAL